MQDLKDRYYSVCRKLVRNRPWAGDDASKASLLASFQFDKGKLYSLLALRPNYDSRAEREMTRKKYVASLESRTPEQISEEEALYVEIKRLEQNERRFKRERDELLRTLLGVDSGLPEIVGMVDDEGPMGGSVDSGKKRRRGTLDSPMTPSNVISLGPPMPRRAQSAKSAAYGMFSPSYCSGTNISHLSFSQMPFTASFALTHHQQRQQPQKQLINLSISVPSSFQFQKPLSPRKSPRSSQNLEYRTQGW
jgi:hypothetical protein